MKKRTSIMLLVAVFATGLAFATQKLDSWCEGEQQYIYQGGTYVEVPMDYLCWYGTVNPVCTFYKTGANSYAPCRYGEYIGIHSSGLKK